MKAPTAPGFFTRLAGIILLAVFGAGQLPVLPLLAAAAAALDGGHRVELTADRDGVRLVLHHDGSPADSVRHRHGSLLRLIAADTGEGRHPDHQLLFTAAGRLAKEQETPVPALKDIAAHGVAAQGEGLVLPFPGFVSGPVSTTTPLRFWWPPPPAECAWGCVVLVV